MQVQLDNRAVPVRWLVLLGCLHLVLLWVTTSRTAVWGDALQLYKAAASLVEAGTPRVPAGMHADVIQGQDGGHYTKYSLAPIANCVPVVGAYRLGKALTGGQRDGITALLVGLWPAVVGAAMAVGFALLLLAFGAGRRAAALCSLALTFCTPLWIYHRSLYGEGLQAALYVWTLLCWIMAARTGSKGWTAAGGALAGLCLNAKPTLVVLCIAAVAHYLWTRRGKPKPLLFALLPFAPLLAAWLWYNALRYGSFLALGYTRGRDTTLGFGTPLLSGLYGLLLSSGKSVLLYAPGLFPSLAAAPELLRKRRGEAGVLVLPALAMLFMVAGWWAWHGDWAWGPRLVMPLLPALMLPLAAALERGGRWRAVVLMAAATGLLVNLPGVLIHEAHYPSIVTEMQRSIYQAGPGADPVRDDMLMPHFVPEFSPVVAHLWLLASLALGRKWAAENPPWRSLAVPAWRPKEQLMPRGLNLWFNGSAGCWAAAAALLALAAWLTSRLRRDLPERRDDETTVP